MIGEERSPVDLLPPKMGEHRSAHRTSRDIEPAQSGKQTLCWPNLSGRRKRETGGADRAAGGRSS
jgi:hypothetical protein